MFFKGLRSFFYFPKYNFIRCLIMLKKSSIRRIMIATLALFILIIIYLFPTSDEISESLSYIDAEELPIFLIDKMEYVARTSIVKNKSTTDDIIKEIVTSLTIDGEKSAYIPDGFKAIIPKGTEVLDIELKEGLLKLNLSKEFLNVAKEDEEKMLEALIYSLTELNEIERISIFVDGVQLRALPSGKKIPNALDKSFGINKIYNLDSVKDTSKTTVYYLSKHNDLYYYVPVTTISNDKQEKVEIIIKELKTTPIYHTNLISYLATSTNLLNYELLENSISLSFDNYLLANLNDDKILEEVKYSIALSLRDTYGVREVIFNVLNEEAATMVMN